MEDEESFELTLDIKLRRARSDRYACQSVARKAIPDERVSKCLRQSLGGNIQVWKHLKTEKAFYNGLFVCGSVWHCPVCAAKISERRRLEMKTAYDTHIANGGKISLLTLTFSHFKKDRLKDTLLKFGQATSRFMSGKRFQNIRDELGLIGRVRAFEITYGENGFHPHIHLALFYTNDVDLEQVQTRMYNLWQKACLKFGLNTSMKFGLLLEDGEKANDYLAKHGTWGLDQELTKSHIKKAKNYSMSPFDFLRKYLETEDILYLNLFREYAEALKGKRQLQWSQGLKQYFGITDKTDEEVATEKTEMADLLGLLTYEEWKIILKFDNRAEFLSLVENTNFDTAKEFLINHLRFIKKEKKEARLEASEIC